MTVLTAVTDAIQTSFTPFCGGNATGPTLAVPAEDEIYIAAGIPFSGAQPWILTLLLPKVSALALTKALAGIDIPLESTDMTDAVGELVNILAGHVVERMETAGHKSSMSLPMVARGEHVKFYPPHAANLRMLNYETPAGRFWIRITLVNRSRALGVG
jgi:chemotaxis protein CheX